MKTSFATLLVLGIGGCGILDSNVEQVLLRVRMLNAPDAVRVNTEFAVTLDSIGLPDSCYEFALIDVQNRRDTVTLRALGTHRTNTGCFLVHRSVGPETVTIPGHTGDSVLVRVLQEGTPDLVKWVAIL